MDVPVAYFVNSGFAWFIVLLAIVGYFLTQKRMHEKWLFWIILAVGWGFFAVAQTLIVTGIDAGTPYLIALWLSSYVLVIVSLVLLFIQLTKVRQ